MEWRTIPGFTDYEISSGGTVRDRITGRRLPERGRKVALRALYDRKDVRVRVAELLEKTFGRDEGAEAGELSRLRSRVAELETLLDKARVLLARERKLRDAALDGPALPQPATKKRYCVVCGCLLPPGYWRRCPDHSNPEDALSEEDFNGRIAL